MYNKESYQLGTQRSVIRELFEYGNRRAEIVGRENVLDFSLGNPSIPTPPQVTQTLLELVQAEDPLSLHGYTSGIGDYATRLAISRDLNARYGCHTRPEEFFLGCGAAPELTAVFRALAVPDGEILAIAPYFPEYKPFVENAGLIFKAVPPDLPDFQLNLAALACAITTHTQALILNSPNNPTGVVYSRWCLEKLSALLENKAAEFGHPIYIVSDEPYRELAYDVAVPFLPGIYRDTVVCYSYSKSLSLPGERIGYVYVPRSATDGAELYAAVAGAARAMGHVCAPSLWQKVIARCADVRPDLAAYEENRRCLWEGLTAMGYETARPDGAFYLFVKAPGGDAVAFSERAKQRDLLVVPGDGFGCPGYFRLSYCVSLEIIQKSLPVFEKLIVES